MAALADLPTLVGFFSYSREDDNDSEEALSKLRDRIQRELRSQLGRSNSEFRIWQDKEIAFGRKWESEISNAINQASFFVPIITPTVINSHHCKFEFNAFLEREKALGRTDLVFPIYYIRVPALEDEARWRNDPLLQIIASRQWVDWRPLRHDDVNSQKVREAVAEFCAQIVGALNKPGTPPVAFAPEPNQESRQAPVEATASPIRIERHTSDSKPSVQPETFSEAPSARNQALQSTAGAHPMLVRVRQTSLAMWALVPVLALSLVAIAYIFSGNGQRTMTPSNNGPRFVEFRDTTIHGNVYETFDDSFPSRCRSSCAVDAKCKAYSKAGNWCQKLDTIRGKYESHGNIAGYKE